MGFRIFKGKIETLRPTKPKIFHEERRKEAAARLLAYMDKIYIRVFEIDLKFGITKVVFL